MMSLPKTLVCISMLGIGANDMLPDKFNEFSTGALVTVVALAVLFFSYKKEQVLQNVLKRLADTIENLDDTMSKKPCLLDKDALNDIFQQK